jgi:hypothetical protein
MTDEFDSETEPCRPVSCLSLPLPYDRTEDDYDNHFNSENLTDALSRPYSSMSVASYTPYYESEFETEDESKLHSATKSRKKNKAVFGHIPGKKMDISHFGFR